MIEQERLRLHLPHGGACPTVTMSAVTIPVNASAPNLSIVHSLSASSSSAWFEQLINPDASNSAAELASSVEGNLERLADLPDSSPGPSQFAVHWLVRRLMPRNDDNEGQDQWTTAGETKAATDLSSAQMDQFRNEDIGNFHDSCASSQKPLEYVRPTCKCMRTAILLPFMSIGPLIFACSKRLCTDALACLV